MTDTLIIKGSPVAAHENTYKHANLMSDAQKAAFDGVVGTPSAENPVVLTSGIPDSGPDLSLNAHVYLDFADATAGGILTNKGLWGADANFAIYGNWTKFDQGDGYIYTHADANLGGFQLKPVHSDTTATASLVSFDYNNGSAQVVMDDTANDLQALYGGSSNTIHKRHYQITLYSEGATKKGVTGFIGEISKNVNRYTISVYQDPTGTARNWETISSGALDTPYKWMIFPNHGYINSGTNASGVQLPMGFAVSFWIYIPDATTDNIYFTGKWGNFADHRSVLNWILYQTSTNNTLTYYQRRYSDGATVGGNIQACLASAKWHCIGLTMGYQTEHNWLRVYLNGHCIYQGSSLGSTFPAAFPLAIAFAGYPGAGTEAIFWNGGKWAQYRYWNAPQHGHVFESAFLLDKALLGFQSVDMAA